MTVNKNSLKNLKPAQKGDVRNPGGRSKTARLTSKQLQDLIGTESIKLIINKVIKQSLDGNTECSKFVLSRLLPAQPREPSISEDFVLEGESTLEKIIYLQKNAAGNLNTKEVSAYETMIMSEQNLIDSSKMDLLLSKIEELEINLSKKK